MLCWLPGGRPHLPRLQDSFAEVRLDPVGRTAVPIGPLPKLSDRSWSSARYLGSARRRGSRHDRSRVRHRGRHDQRCGRGRAARLLAVREQLDQANALVVVAGMEMRCPAWSADSRACLAAVPTSVGYGASFGGLAVLLAMLNSCAPGVTVVNIDNGFGAAVACRPHRPERAVTQSMWWIDAGAGASGDMLPVRCWPWIPDWHRLNRPWTRCSVGWEPNGYTSRCRPLTRRHGCDSGAHVRCEQTAEHRAWRDIAPALAGFDHAETVFGLPPQRKRRCTACRSMTSISTRWVP